MFLIVENVSLQAQCHASDESEHARKDPAGPYFFVWPTVAHIYWFRYVKKMHSVLLHL